MKWVDNSKQQPVIEHLTKLFLIIYKIITKKIASCPIFCYLSQSFKSEQSCSVNFYKFNMVVMSSIKRRHSDFLKLELT